MRHITLITLAILTIGTGCADKQAELAPAKDAPVAMESTHEAFAPGDRSHMAANSPETSTTRSTPSRERKVIRSANISVSVDAPHDKTAEIEGVVETLGGFIVSSSLYGTSESGSSSLTIRVPADGFHQALDRFRSLGDVRSETVSGKDVTEEFVDLKARLDVQRNLETRYLTLLSEATTIADTLAVEEELARVRTEIERMEGRKQFLQDQVAMSTIQLEVVSPAQAHDDSALGEIGEAFADSGEIAVAVVAGAIRVAAALIPIGLILGLLGFAVIRLFSSIRDRKSAKATEG
jgi:hypothetical protein